MAQQDRIAGRRAPLARSCAAAAALALAAGARPTQAQQATANWMNPVSGIWTEGANWSTGVAPDNGSPAGVTYAASIAATGANYTVSLATPVTLDSLALN